MNEQQLRAALKAAMKPYRDKPFAQLEGLMDQSQEVFVAEGNGEIGCKIRVIWADFETGYITVYGTARERPNSHLMRWFPFLSKRAVETFTVSPEDKIVDEESI